MGIIALFDRSDRAFAARLVWSAKPGTRFELLPPKATDPQRARMWALLTDISSQYVHAGRRHDPETWRGLMLQACGQEIDWVPTLDGKSLLPFGGSTEKMGVAEMGEFLSFIESWGVMNGVEFRK